MPLITNDATVLGILLILLALIFYTASLKGWWLKFYSIVPPLLLCYFIPGVLNSLGVISGDDSKLYPIASQFLLPACLVFFTLGMDVNAIIKLGPKALIVFFAGTLGVMVGGPLAILIVKNISPATVGGEGADAVWRGLSTIAGSWIGGGANQTALKEVFKPSDHLFSQVVAVDVIIAEFWMALLIYGAGKAVQLDRFLKADSEGIETLKNRLESEQQNNQRIPALKDFVFILAVGFGATGIAHFLAEIIVPFLKTNFVLAEKLSLTSTSFWVISIVTSIGIGLSFTPLRKLEYAGASKIGSLFLYMLVMTIGMKMNLFAVGDNLGLFVVGLIWMSVHAGATILAAKWTKAPFFFAAVGSQANVGGVASASVVAAAFHPSLTSVGVLLAILGYAIGTYCGYITGLLMQWVS